MSRGSQYLLYKEYNKEGPHTWSGEVSYKCMYLERYSIL